ncbi:muramoyltetrapeptide carboxypeptidase [Massilia sp. Leaf139]|uniref:muramoyltetrapeptide carboxypeptidase n=1 Tax=Massilia sp. Leaf139 TaxID=1736272 RepID=UPI0006FEC5D5|nr:muramoyltetrapeptide carboxypeptidase [Massilia sp. Leaf139]KQQ97394.1 LD-carboxypeptidase [Massilia sp. Leaf139]
MTNPRLGVAIVAPAGHVADPCAVDRGIAYLQARGCRVHNYYDHQAIYQRFGGTDAARLAALYAAAENPEVDLVMAVRGGYGLTRLLPDIDFARLAAGGKLFVGYSDITALQMGLYAKTGALSYAGPFVANDFGALDPVAFTLDDFWACLAGPTHTIVETCAGNPRVEAAGTIWGGNLAMLGSLIGTEWFPRIEGGILFVEDIAEHPYRIERLLLQLMQTGVLARQQALVLGDFSDYRLGALDNGYDFDAMLDYLRATLPIPIVSGLSFGHIPRRVTIPFGAKATLASNGDGFRLTLSDYPTRTGFAATSDPVSRPK